MAAREEVMIWGILCVASLFAMALIVPLLAAGIIAFVGMVGMAHAPVDAEVRLVAVAAAAFVGGVAGIYYNGFVLFAFFPLVPVLAIVGYAACGDDLRRALFGGN